MTTTVNTMNIKKAAYAVLLACVMLVVGMSDVLASGYDRGPSGHGFLHFQGRNNSSGGSTSGMGSINRTHRADWQRKLKEQRKYDEYLLKQNARSTAACGFTGAPNYCYRLVNKPRYPAEYRITRY